MVGKQQRMKFLLFSSLLGLGLAADQADCSSVSGGGCDPNADCLDSSNPADVASYCRCRWGYEGVGSLTSHSVTGQPAECTATTDTETAVCGDGIVGPGEDCDFGTRSAASATDNDEYGGGLGFSQHHEESGDCTSCQWTNCPWRIARNAPTPLAKWQTEGNNIGRNEFVSQVDINFALFYPKAYHHVHENPWDCDELTSPDQGHSTPGGEPYDPHAPITEASSTGGSTWHWPEHRNIGPTTIELSATSRTGGTAPACMSLNGAESTAACPAGSTLDTCEQGWYRDGSKQRLVDQTRNDACAHAIFYRTNFANTVAADCYVLKEAATADALSYFTSYLRIHNVEVDLDVEDLRHAQLTMGQGGDTPEDGNPGGMFSRIFTRRNVDIELPFFITFNKTVEATAELAVTSSLFGFSAVVDYIEYVVNAFGATGSFEDGSTAGSGAGSITLATSINPGYKLNAATTGGLHYGVVTESSLGDGAPATGAVTFGLPADVGGINPYDETSFGCDATDDDDTLDGQIAHRCEQFWKYTMTAAACSFGGIYSATWDVRCNKAVGQAICPGATGIDAIVYERSDVDGTVTGNANQVSITFTLDAGPDDCVQEFDNDVILSATLTCSSEDGGGSAEVFHNQMLFCHLDIDSGVELLSSALDLVENKHGTDLTGASNGILYPTSLVGAALTAFNWAVTTVDANNIKFQFRVTPTLFKQDFDARNPWFIYALATVEYKSGSSAKERRLLSLSPSLTEQRNKCLENGCAELGPLRSLLQLEEDGGAVQGQSKAFVQGLDYQPDVPVVADDVYLADLDMGMEDEEDAAQPIVLNTLVLAGLGFLAMH